MVVMACFAMYMVHERKTPHFFPHYQREAGGIKEGLIMKQVFICSYTAQGY